MIGTGSRQRRHRRFLIDIGAGASGARLRDISMGGMRIMSQQALRIDEVVETGLRTAHGVLRLRGRVVRACRSGVKALPYEYGIALDQLDRDSDVLLRRFLDDLGAKVAPEPESPVEPLDLQRLQDRIEELERELALCASAAVDSLHHQPAGDAAGAPSGAPSPTQPVAGEDCPEQREDLVTSFDLTSFEHLVRLGQPMLPLVGDCATRVAGEECQTVAGAFEARFDLAHVKRKVGTTLDEAAIVATLFTFYERNLIDFA